MEHTVVRPIKTTYVQQLACQASLNNFTINIWPNYCMDKLIFPVKWQLKLAKQEIKIILVEELKQILKLEYK